MNDTTDIHNGTAGHSGTDIHNGTLADKMIALRELVELLGLKNHHTLQTWINMGHIEPAVRGRGQGKHSMFDYKQALAIASIAAHGGKITPAGVASIYRGTQQHDDMAWQYYFQETYKNNQILKDKDAAAEADREDREYRGMPSFDDVGDLHRRIDTNTLKVHDYFSLGWYGPTDEEPETDTDDMTLDDVGEDGENVELDESR